MNFTYRCTVFTLFKKNLPVIFAAMSTLVQKDKKYIWHPFTQHKHNPSFLPIEKAEGLYLIDENGNKYMDAISSWWTNLHGHAHPYIAEKIYRQALELEHVIFAGCTHGPAVQLAERLLPLLPGNMGKVFYSDNGSTAVEVALKMAIQFWKNQDIRHKNKIIALKHAYHGDTFGAMSVSERGVFTLPFADYLFEVIFIDLFSPADTSQSIAKLENYKEETACFIYEPLVQGAGGMNMTELGNLEQVLHFCRENSIICIADEVMTGFGRTGKLFAGDYLTQKPDIICLSKGLTGGALPLAVTACTDDIFNAFLLDDLHKTFFHGHSYTANPLACAAALASLDLLEKEDCIKNIAAISRLHRQFISTVEKSSAFSNPRSCGTILAFELDSQEPDYLNKVKEETMKSGLEQGIFIRPLGNTVYIMPPYCIREEELEKLYDFLSSLTGLL